MDILKKRQKERKTANIGEKLELLCLAGGNVSRVASVEDDMAVPQKLKQNDHVIHFSVYMQRN